MYIYLFIIDLHTALALHCSLETAVIGLTLASKVLQSEGEVTTHRLILVSHDGHVHTTKWLAQYKFSAIYMTKLHMYIYMYTV